MQVAETLPADVLEKMHAPEKPVDVPVIDPHVIDQADGFVFGFPTRSAIEPSESHQKEGDKQMPSIAAGLLCAVQCRVLHLGLHS